MLTLAYKPTSAFMANKAIEMIKVRQILRLYEQGHSKVQISVLTGVARNTLKRYLRKFIAGQYTFEQVSSLNDHELEMLFGNDEEPKVDPRFDVLQKLLPEINKQLKRKGMTLLRLWEQYREQYPNGYKITQFCYYHSQYNKGTNPVMHQEHKAGDKMYIDFAGEKLKIVDLETGEVRSVEVFAAILGSSQLTYVEAVYSQRKEDLIVACENAMHYFGGVPAAIVPDNLKSAVTKSSKYEPLINETFADFAEHYGTAVIPARAYRPKDKSLVEGIIKIIYTRIYVPLDKHTFFTLPQLNEAIRQELEHHNNALLKGRDYSRRQQFEEIERSALLALPVYRYEFKQQKLVTVMKNGHVGLSVDKHYYSVPYRFIGKKVKVLYTSTQVEIFYRYERIGAHSRDMRKYQYTTLNEHLASAHRYLSDWTAEKFIEQGRALHEDVALYICKVIEGKSHPEQAYKSCSGILNLARKVGPDRLIKACQRAHLFGVFNYPIVVQILEKKLDAFRADTEDVISMPQHDNIRGSDYYQ
jgi:transposase